MARILGSKWCSFNMVVFSVRGLLRKARGGARSHFGRSSACERLDGVATCMPRQQNVKVGHSRSNWKPFCLGVPQGTKLGPLFFLVMVNDLSTALPLHKYGDNCTVYEVISASATDSSILEQLQLIMRRKALQHFPKTGKATVDLIHNDDNTPEAMADT